MNRILYKKEKFITEKHEFQVENMKSVFLKGRTESENSEAYLGIWVTAKGLREVTINKNNIHYDYSHGSSVSTEITVKNFLGKHNLVEKISKELFFNKLNDIKELLSS